jgi:hypothetical protein
MCKDAKLSCRGNTARRTVVRRHKHVGLKIQPVVAHPLPARIAKVAAEQMRVRLGLAGLASRMTPLVSLGFVPVLLREGAPRDTASEYGNTGKAQWSR